jgi:hypothetical protein
MVKLKSSSSLPRDISKRVDDIESQMATLNRHMATAEMSDDRYYTNGRRDRDQVELHRLKSELERLTALK